MDKKTPADFSNHGEWISYVRDHVPVPEQAYALACGRTELFRSFYEVRQRALPVEFAKELEHIRTLRDPARTNALESLNERIFASLTDFLSYEVRPEAVEAETVTLSSAQEQIQELLDHLAKKNPYFALWTVYKKGVNDHSIADEWDDYLLQEIGAESSEEIVFTRTMVELDKLLSLLHDSNRALPRHFYERAWFLHYLREPERMLQTRSLLNTLTTEIAACTSA
jgi:flagellar motor switch protein FliG